MDNLPWFGFRCGTCSIPLTFSDLISTLWICASCLELAQLSESSGCLTCHALFTEEAQNCCDDPFPTFRFYWAQGATHSLLKYWKKTQNQRLLKRLIQKNLPYFLFWLNLVNLKMDFKNSIWLPIPQSRKRAWILKGGSTFNLANELLKQTPHAKEIRILEHLEIENTTQIQAISSVFERRILKPTYSLSNQSDELLADKRITLIDDWATTGSTLRNWRHLLRARGWQVNAAIVLGQRPPGMGIIQENRIPAWMPPKPLSRT